MSLLITFEGIDGSGKSTQIEKIAEWLRGEDYSVLVTREPGGTAIGEAVREILLNPRWSEMDARTEFLLYSASRAQLVEQLIRPQLELDRGIVLVDRYADSSTAYQGGGRKLGIPEVESVNSFATANLTPDLTFVLDVDWQTSRLRISGGDPDRLETNPRDFFERTRQAYHDLCTKYPDRMKLVDATRSVFDVYKEIQTEIASRLPRK